MQVALCQRQELITLVRSQSLAKPSHESLKRRVELVLVFTMRCCEERAAWALRPAHDGV